MAAGSPNYIEEIKVHTSILPKHAADCISEIMQSHAIDLMARERALEYVLTANKHAESTKASEQLIVDLRRASVAKHEKFMEMLKFSVKLAGMITQSEVSTCPSTALGTLPPKRASAAEIVAEQEKAFDAARARDGVTRDDNPRDTICDAESDSSSEDASSSAEDMCVYLRVEDVPPHKFGLRDIVDVSLEVRVFGTIAARGPMIAIAELTEGCWIHSVRADVGFGEIKLLKAKTNILVVNNIPIIPYDVYSNCSKIGYLRNWVDGEYKQQILLASDGAVYQRKKICEGKSVDKAIPLFPILAHERCTNTFITSGFLDRMATTCWQYPHANSEYRWGLSDCVKGQLYTGQPTYGEVKYLSMPLPNHPDTMPKYKILRYEQSYQVLVAAPWDFELDKLRARIAEGETLNIREEIERVLIGQDTPTPILGRGIRFEHVLESQIKTLEI
jgi:hypothetical protein